MKEITKKLREEIKIEFMPLAVQLRKEGKDDADIIRVLQDFKKIKVLKFYRKPDFEAAKSLFNKTKTDIENRGGLTQDQLNKYNVKLPYGADSKIELRFLDMLEKEKIPYNFQVKIGFYRVDFLIANYLIFEGDGPQHAKTKDYDKQRDMYLEKMGYKIFRVSWELVAQLPERIIDVIKDELI